MGNEDPLTTLLILVIVMYSIVLHEIAHGFAALQFGDPTAKDLGRLSLNPVLHADPFGTVIFPALQVMVFGHFMIGWAKPVPVRTHDLRPRVLGDVVVSLAGIIVNLLIATVLLGIVGWSGLVNPGHGLEEALVKAAFYNVILAAFNLLPIPPLDGSHVMKYLLPPEMRPGYQRIGFAGILIILLLDRARVLDPILWRPAQRLFFELTSVFGADAAVIRAFS